MRGVGRGVLAAVVAGWAAVGGALSGQQPPAGPEGHVHVENLQTTTIKPMPPAARRPGFLGLQLAKKSPEPAAADQKSGTVPGPRFVVTGVAADSPAARAGLTAGDRVLAVGGQPPASLADLRGRLLAGAPGETVVLSTERGGKRQDVAAVLAATSRPRAVADGPGGPARAYLGVQTTETKDRDGLEVMAVVAGSPAEKADIRAGDVLLKVQDVPLTTAAALAEALAEYRPGDPVTLGGPRGGEPFSAAATLAGASPGRGPRSAWENRLPTLWKADRYRLGVVLVGFPDVGFNPKVNRAAWEKALFSRDSYTRQSPTGQKVYGSLADYYHEQSYGKLAVTGRVFAPVAVAKRRAEYAAGSSPQTKSVFLSEALDRLLERDGPRALDDLDGLCFIHAGGRVQGVNRGSLFWPHRASFPFRGKRWGYFLCPEGGERMTTISVFCHEFGHLLGLPDLYARPENPGSEGAGVWDAMSNGEGRLGRPCHFGAWCKEQLGWTTPAVLDPTLHQRILLRPSSAGPKEVLKVLARPDGTEYFLLENRTQTGFDATLPGSGLLIWRVVMGRPMLEESHGVEGPAGPRSHLGMVPYPSPANDSFTPHTQPSSRSQLGGGPPVFITNIRRLPDGTVALEVGAEYY